MVAGEVCCGFFQELVFHLQFPGFPLELAQPRALAHGQRRFLARMPTAGDTPSGGPGGIRPPAPPKRDPEPPVHSPPLTPNPPEATLHPPDTQPTPCPALRA